MSKGSWSISGDLIDSIEKHLPKGSTILELGSGYGTRSLVRLGYTLISVEQDNQWINLHHNNYCFAPLKNGWYDMDIVNEFIKNKTYDAVLIDGPASGDRSILLESNLDLSKILFVDDIDRPRDRHIFNKLKQNRKHEDHATYGVIFS